MTSIECGVCQQKYLVYDQSTYACECGNLFGFVKCTKCGVTSQQEFDETEVFTKNFNCTYCQFAAILSPCINCSQINLRVKDQDPCQCKNCNTSTLYAKCEKWDITFGIDEGKDSIDGKLLRCPLNCAEMLALKCTNCNFIVQCEASENKMTHYCSNCKKSFYKQLCDSCKQVTVVPEKQYSAKLKQKCTNKKCKQFGVALKDVKLQGLPIIQGKLIHPNQIDPVPEVQQQIIQQTTNQGSSNKPKISEPINLLDEEVEDPQQGKSKVVVCIICKTSTDCIITTPCNHKVCCYQCLNNLNNCSECNQPIINRILNTFNRDFDQEIKERIEYERSK